MAASAKVNDIPMPKGEEITQGVGSSKFERRMRVLHRRALRASTSNCLPVVYYLALANRVRQPTGNAVFAIFLVQMMMSSSVSLILPILVVDVNDVLGFFPAFAPLPQGGQCPAVPNSQPFEHGN
jgi:hypothetical protein